MFCGENLLLVAAGNVLGQLLWGKGRRLELESSAAWTEVGNLALKDKDGVQSVQLCPTCHPCPRLESQAFPAWIFWWIRRGWMATLSCGHWLGVQWGLRVAPALLSVPGQGDWGTFWGDTELWVLSQLSQGGMHTPRDCARVSRAKGNVLHLGWDNPKHQSRLGMQGWRKTPQPNKKPQQNHPKNVFILCSIL